MPYMGFTYEKEKSGVRLLLYQQTRTWQAQKDEMTLGQEGGNKYLKSYSVSFTKKRILLHAENLKMRLTIYWEFSIITHALRKRTILY